MTFRYLPSPRRTAQVAAALDADKPAVVDIKVDPDALYSFRRDSFAHRA